MIHELDRAIESLVLFYCHCNIIIVIQSSHAVFWSCNAIACYFL